MIDLHIHTTASDGTDSPSSVVDKALNIKINSLDVNGISYVSTVSLKAIAITDHDTVNGVEEAVNHGTGKNITVIPGTELSSEYLFNGKRLDLHILGYNIDYKNRTLIHRLDEIAGYRNIRNEKIAAALREFAGSDITVKKLHLKYGDGVLTRANFANYIADEGKVKNKDEAFVKFLDKGCPCYFPKVKISVQEAIDIIHNSGGKAVLAHPVLIKEIEKDELNGLLKELADMGIEGLECYYTNNRLGDTDYFIKAAQKYNLFCTGGSDYHGTIKRISLGTGYPNDKNYDRLCVPDELLNNIL